MNDHERQRLPAGIRALFAGGDDGRSLLLPLPPGSLVWADPGYPQHQASTGPAFWISDEPVDGDLWARLRAEHRTSGLWPVLLDDSTQPWSAGQIAPEPVTAIDKYDVPAFMAEVWADGVDEYGGKDADLAPYGRHCPGPAAPGVLMDAPDTIADQYADFLSDGSTRLGLAAVTRGADALTVMGWQGAVNHNQWIAPLAAVIRSWEDRFGVRVVRMGFNTLDLSVAAPPVTAMQALHVAAEHWTFCPDNIYQCSGTLAGYAEKIRGRNSWTFWWD